MVKVKRLLLFCILAFTCTLRADPGPDFFVIGAAKCGTLSMYRYLIKHPSILSASHKELHFFNRARYKQGDGMPWYLEQFPQNMTPSQLSFDGSPSYLFHPLVPERVHKHYPDTKLIILIRDPVDRLYSQYRYRVKTGREERALEQVIEEELTILDAKLKNPTNSYLARGIYKPQIKRWRKYFAKEQILILFSKDFYHRTDEVMNEVYRFLNLPEFSLTDYPRYNLGDQSDVLNPKIRAFLEDFYRPYNEQLRKYLRNEFDLEMNF